MRQYVCENSRRTVLKPCRRYWPLWFAVPKPSPRRYNKTYMQLCDIFLRLGEENFQQLIRSISIGRLKTFQLYDRVKTRLYLD